MGKLQDPVFANNYLHIIRDAKSTEKRDLAACPTDYLEIKAIAAFEKCFDDNFSFRNKAIKEMSLAKLEVFDKPTLGNVSKGKNDWFYYNNAEYIEQVTGVKKYSRDEKSKVKEALKSRKEFFDQNKIDYQMLVVPSKLSIYPENFDRPITVSNQTRMEEFDVIAQEVGFQSTDLKKQLLEQKNIEQVFHPNDSHWNYNGMIVAYAKLVERFDLVPEIGRAHV